jgi:DNA-binding CsgD family transcriptional regulator/tetratricopeptide (TPR) repeat protein
MLLGRDHERTQIEWALTQARSGESATLALVGEPGIGKTALLDHAARRAEGMSVLHARGVQSEAQIPFASLLELLRPALVMLDQLPRPQAVALESALALRPASLQERFAVGAATLGLLAAYADSGPVAVLVDDAHWLDGSSAQALLFAFRRLVADPIAAVLTVREGEPSLLDGADLPTLRIGGLTSSEAATLLDGVAPVTAERLHRATAGNPLALLELVSEADDLALAPEGAPLLVSARVSQAFLRRTETLDDPARLALALVATSESRDLATLERAAQRLGADLATLSSAESAGLIAVRAGSVEFRHPLARSAIYADTPVAVRRDAHRALAASLPDRDVDRRAWHLAEAAVGTDDSASAALEQAGARGQARSSYATATAAFERAARLAPQSPRRANLLWQAAQAAWLAGFAERAGTLLDEARDETSDPIRSVDIDRLAGHIATRRGPVMRGHAILTEAASRADGDRAAEMLAEAAYACFLAGNSRDMLDTAQRARARLTAGASIRARFKAVTADGMARIIGGDAAAGAEAIREAIALAEGATELRDDPALLPWLALAPIFAREASAGRSLLEHAVSAARERAAVGSLPFLLNLIARDQATTDRWALAEATYREAIELARESDQRTELVFGLAGLAWLDARRGRQPECRASAAEALELCARLGTRLHEVWATAALGELELGLGEMAAAVRHFERQRALLADLSITDVDLSPAPELVDAYLRLGRTDDARTAAREFAAAAGAKGQPWPLARAARCEAQVADDPVGLFEQALAHHAQTVDAFEEARTRLAYGERLRRARNRVLAREQLRAAAQTFERLDAKPWADRAATEFAATGETLRRRDPNTIDALTPQELQIAVLLASGKTTRETAATLFLSPKTVEYHLRHAYQKLDIHSREELAQRLAGRDSGGQPVGDATSVR